MDLDLREAFDHGFGPEPGHRPVSERIEAGHRAVRRRRLAGTVVALAAATVVGFGTVAVVGDGPGGTSPVAVEPPLADPASDWGDGDLARYDDDGVLVTRPGVTVLQRIDEPFGDAHAHHHSVAMAVEFRGAQTWMMLTWESDGGGSTSATIGAANPTGGSFEAWVADQVAANEDNSAGYVEFAGDGSLASSHGVQILDQRYPVRLEGFTAGDEPTAAALLQGPDGKKWYVLVRDVDGVEVIAVPFRTGGADLDAFVTYATKRYTSGKALP